MSGFARFRYFYVKNAPGFWPEAFHVDVYQSVYFSPVQAVRVAIVSSVCLSA